MITVPIGNNIVVRWSILFNDNTVFPLSEYEYELSYRNSRGETVVSDSAVVSLEDNVLVWRFSGEEQSTIGRYSLKLRVIRGGDKVATFLYDSAFALTNIPEYIPVDTFVRITSYTEDYTLMSQHALTVAYEVRDYLDETIRKFEEGKEQGFATKGDLEGYATKEDLQNVSVDLSDYVTKSELEEQIQKSIIKALNSNL